LVFTDWWYGQKTTDKTIDAQVAMIQRHKTLRWAHESGPIDHAVGPALRRAMREAKPHPVFTILTPMPSIKSKVIKLSTLQAWAAQGRVWFPLNRPWADRAIDQLCNFPAAKYDDGADAAGLLARMLDAMMAGTLESEQRKPQLVPFTAEWLEYQEQATAKTRYV
jgi:predicted phage terminase large subunit-like protein